MADGTDKTRNVEKLATEGQNTQPIHQSDGITPENLPVEEEREKQAEMKKMVKNR